MKKGDVVICIRDTFVLNPDKAFDNIKVGEHYIINLVYSDYISIVGDKYAYKDYYFMLLSEYRERKLKSLEI
jgi:hypothetical protein